MKKTWTQTINVAVGVLPVSVSVSPPQSYVGYPVECTVNWEQDVPNLVQEILFEWGDGMSDWIPNHVCAYPPCSYTISHPYQAVGTYTIKVTITDEFARSGSDTASVQIADQLSGYFNASPISGDAPLIVTFDFRIIGGYRPYTWVLTTGDGGRYEGTEDVKIIEHTYLEKGSFTATLTAMDALGNLLVAEAGIGVGIPAVEVVPSLVVMFGSIAAGLGLIYAASRR